VRKKREGVVIKTAPATCEECGVTVVVTATAGQTEDGRGFTFSIDVRSPFLHQCALKKRNELEDDLMCPRLRDAAEEAIDRAL
jgi:hypothetical protein